MNSADMRTTRPVRPLSRIHGRIKLISESSESKLISESDGVEDIVKFFRTLSTMEPKRNKKIIDLKTALLNEAELERNRFI